MLTDEQRKILNKRHAKLMKKRSHARRNRQLKNITVGSLVYGAFSCLGGKSRW